MENVLPFFPIEEKTFSDEYIHKYEKFGIFSCGSPPFSADNLINFNSYCEFVFQKKLDQDNHDPKEIITILFNAPEFLVSFKSVNLSDLTYLQSMLNSPSSDSDFNDNMLFFAPLFIRVSIEQIDSDIFINYSRFIFQNFPDNPYAIALKIKIHASLIITDKKNVRQNMENNLSKIVSNLIKLIQTKAYYDMNTSLFPQLLPQVTEIVAISYQFLFNEGNNDKASTINTLYSLCKFFLLVATTYPPAFSTIPWQSLSKHLSQVGYNKTSEYPDYEFASKYTHLCISSQISYNIQILLDSFALFSYQAIQNSTKFNKSLIYSVLIKLSHGHPAASRAISKSLITLSRYPFFNAAFKVITEDIQNNHELAVTLYAQITSFNFSKEVSTFENKYRLTEKIEKHMNGFQRILSLNAHNLITIFDVIRLTDGLLLQDSAKFIIFLHANNYLEFLKNYLSEFMKKSISIKDMRYSQPFAHLAVQYVKIRTRMSSPDSEYLGLDIGLILQLYRAITLSGPYLLNRSQTFSIISADLYLERRNFVKALRPFCPKFLLLAFYYVKNQAISLLESLILLISDIFIFTKTDPKFLDPIKEVLKNEISYLIQTESIYVFLAITNIYQHICENSTKSLASNFTEDLLKRFSDYTSKNDKTFLRIGTKIILLLKLISFHPKVKIIILHCKESANFWNSLNKCLLVSNMGRIEHFHQIILEFLTSILSPDISINREFDFECICATETIDNDHLEKIITTICSILEKEKPDRTPDSLYITALKTLRFACQNPFIVKIMKSNQFKLNSSIKTFSQNDQTSDYWINYMDIALTVAKTDSTYAKELINWNEKHEDFLNSIPFLLDEDFTNEIQHKTQELETIFSQPIENLNYPSIELKKIQQKYQEQVDYIDHLKTKYYSSPIPLCTTYDFFSEIPSQLFSIYGKISE